MFLLILTFRSDADLKMMDSIGIDDDSITGQPQTTHLTLPPPPPPRCTAPLPSRFLLQCHYRTADSTYGHTIAPYTDRTGTLVPVAVTTSLKPYHLSSICEKPTAVRGGPTASPQELEIIPPSPQPWSRAAAAAAAASLHHVVVDRREFVAGDDDSTAAVASDIELHNAMRLLLLRPDGNAGASGLAATPPSSFDRFRIEPKKKGNSKADPNVVLLPRCGGGDGIVQPAEDDADKNVTTQLPAATVNNRTKDDEAVLPNAVQQPPHNTTTNMKYATDYSSQTSSYA